MEDTVESLENLRICLQENCDDPAICEKLGRALYKRIVATCRKGGMVIIRPIQDGKFNDQAEIISL